jgi:hypothetical protein
MRFATWASLLHRNRFRMSPTRVPLVVTTATFMTTINSIAARMQQLIYGRRIAATRVRPPIFILGHWRSGTTLLHELIALDDRFSFPTTAQCFCPNDFLVIRWLVTRLTFLMPERRPMDDMAMGWDLPQEDEFALCNLGLPSPYLTIAFPNERPADGEYLDLESLSPQERRRWQRTLHGFLQSVTFRDGRPLVLKSPPHTARIRALLEMFPDARFVHIVRDPRAVFPSTVRLWKSLYKELGLQEPTYAGLDEYVLSSFERMYRAFERQSELIVPGRLFELRYEDLVRDPMGQMQALYKGLGLDGFESVRLKIEAYFSARRDFRPHTYRAIPALDAELDRRWGPFMRRYGYGVDRPG